LLNHRFKLINGLHNLVNGAVRSLIFTAALSVFCSAHSFAATNDVAALQQPVNEPEWLLKQPSQSFAIQILTLSSAQQLQDLVDMQLLKGFARFRYKSGGKLRYVLTFGSYSSAVEADKASQLLVEKLQGFSAPPVLWIRQLQTIQKSIRTTLQY
jgi:septal ring-binding cell division protein DamX